MVCGEWKRRDRERTTCNYYTDPSIPTESLLESPSYKASRIALKKQIHARYPSATAKGTAFDHHLARALSDALDSKELRVKKQTYQLLKVCQMCQTCP